MELPPLILASGSARRREFMTALGLPYTLHPADIDETPRPNETPAELVRRLSQEKGAAVAALYPTALIIAADTVVALDNVSLGKPASPAEARAMLVQLRGRQHEVCTALTLTRLTPAFHHTCLNRNEVVLRSYTEAEIEAYIASGDPFDKAGGYAIQHPEFAPVAAMAGCYAGVVGFPLGGLAAGLSAAGYPCPPIAPRCAGFTGRPCCQATP